MDFEPRRRPHRLLAATLADEAAPRLPDYDVVTDLDRIPAELRGLHTANPVNLGATPACSWSSHPAFVDSARSAHLLVRRVVPPTRALIETLAAVAERWTVSPRPA